MARIRTVKPDFWGHAKTAKVSRDARLLFLGLLNEADDEGRLLASAKAINGSIFPNDDDVSGHDIDLWLKELAGARFVQLYEVDGVRYCLVRGFEKHQKVSHPTPSRLPAPPDECGEVLANGSGIARESFAPDLEVEVDLGSGSRNLEAPLALLVSDPLEGFDAFWGTYPTRNGKKVGRGLCETKWRALSEQERREVLLGTSHYATACERGYTLAKDPERFLKHKVWRDYLDGPGQPERRAGSSRSQQVMSAAEVVAGRIDGRQS